MKIAVVGTGIAGNYAAYRLSQEHDVHVFESNSYIGGHTHTHSISYQGDEQQIDTGFIVFNKKTYPNFLKLLEELNVDYQPSDMSFSVQAYADNLEYNGTNLNSLFAQRRNVFRPSFYRMIQDILKFNRESLDLLQDINNQILLGDYLLENRYSKQFIHHYIVPMGAAIWSTDHQSMMNFPARFFVQFFHNHGMLSVNERPQWYVIKGGSKNYIEPLIAGHKDKIRSGVAIKNIRRTPDEVYLQYENNEEVFDYVFIATHSDQALAMLENPSSLEKEVLGAIPYTSNQAILHTDISVLPKRKRAWAAWNYHLLEDQKEKVALTYNMNILQSIESKNTYCVSLNYKDSIDPQKIIKVIDYAHPFFTINGVNAQKKHSQVNGQYRTFYCGAYWRNGFHEDGVVSSINALKDFERVLAFDKERQKESSTYKEKESVCE
ncbi:NAD(P)/FAD-dependent oxidoreductase [Aliikangiella sp. G2MR2-5]|uniref:NAD(P)/FAD-dependent oxidoreductase n=1 Tax=Aliikangiella sp. G2MR2-5 TaxID=2788943 RepID=UPI0018AA4838|nr:FAD-dependent oxidoreductase [Aliikangiella sp. G2MR2-5]